WLPTFHNLGLVGGFLRQVYEGCSATFMSPLAFLEKPARWLQGMSRLRATATGGPKFAFQLCPRAIPPHQREGPHLSTVRLAGCGSEPVRAGSLIAFAKRFEPYGFRFSAFKPGYGLAETTVVASGPHDDEPPRVLELSATASEHGRVELASA